MANKGREGFTLGMAAVDALPCIFFAIATVYIWQDLQNVIFLIGLILCTLAGLGKVLWKIILATNGGDIQWLFKQLRILMPTGFLLLIIGLIMEGGQIDWINILQQVVSLPALVFFVIGIAGIVGMSVMAKKLDPNDPASNWKEQITNCIAQGGFMMGILMLRL